MALGMRSIWVAIRGINYTDRATREVGRNVDELIKKQQQLRQHSIMLLSAGLMWTAMAGMATFAIWKIMESTAAGHVIMGQFNRAMDKMLKALGAAFVEVMGPTIKMLTGFFNLIAQHPILAKTVAILGTMVITLMLLKGITMMTSGVMGLLSLSHIGLAGATKQTILTQYGCTTSTLTLSGAFNVMKASIGPMLLIFMLFYQIGTMLIGQNPAIIAAIAGLVAIFTVLAAVLWHGAMAMSILTFGLAAAAGLGAAAYAASQTPTYQMGTSSVKRTGLALVHQGEEIRSTREKPKSATETQSPFSRTSNQFEIHLHGNIQTKADKEELVPMMKKAFRECMDNKV